MDYPFNMIIAIIYFILILYIIVYNIKNRFNRKNKKSYKNNNEYSKSIPLSEIRKQYFPSKIDCTDFYISEYMEEVFNIFLKLSPSMISSLNKAEKRILSIKKIMDDPDSDKKYLKEEFKYVDKILNEFIKVSYEMIETFEKNIFSSHSQIRYTKVTKEAVETYIDAVNVLVRLVEDHNIINYEIHTKLKQSYPELIEPFQLIMSKITYLFFINLITYSNKIDENVFLYK